MAAACVDKMLSYPCSSCLFELDTFACGVKHLTHTLCTNHYHLVIGNTAVVVNSMIEVGKVQILTLRSRAFLPFSFVAQTSSTAPSKDRTSLDPFHHVGHDQNLHLY